MNLNKIEVLALAARQLGNISGRATDTAIRLLDKIDLELAGEQDEEIAALQASSNIKQANINLLADEIEKFEAAMYAGESWGDALKSLVSLAQAMRQEEPKAPAAVVN